MKEFQLRNEVFNWLKNLTLFYDDVLPRTVLEKGFVYQGQRLTLVGPSGIWKPKIMDLPISITTTCNSPYSDSFTPEGLLNYKYRGTNPNHSDNIGLRELMLKKIPLVYFHCIVPGKYLATWPVYIMGDDINSLTFTVAVDDHSYLEKETADKAFDSLSDLHRRTYLTSMVKYRLHQRSFRERVIAAYHNQCTLCKLKHQELLDAAHIIPDKEELGQPIIQNGLSLCKIHHAAFDKNILGITPDYIIKVREDVLEEIDGPMLKYGLQSLENNKIILPRNKNFWPDRDRLAMRFDQFISRA